MDLRALTPRETKTVEKRDLRALRSDPRSTYSGYASLGSRSSTPHLIVFIRSKIMWITLAILFFFLYSYLPFFSPRGVYNSPDETANAYFSSVFREEGTLRVREPLESITNDRVRPRSITVHDGALVPESFHGLPVIYGVVSRMSSDALPFLTAIFAILAVFAWRHTMAKLFGHCTGEFAGLLLFFTPAWWYWTNRGLYHNVFFVALLIFAAYFFITKPLMSVIARWVAAKQSRELKILMTQKIDSFLSGFFCGLALWVRTSEAVWILPLVFILWMLYRKNIRWSDVISFMIAACVALIPFFFINAALYGHPFATGYIIPEATSSTVQSMELVSKIESLYRAISHVVFPFGIHLRTALMNFLNYFVAMPWWMTMVLATTLAWLGYQLLRARMAKNEIMLVTIFLALTAYLAILYGSWVIHDSPDPRVVDISISYTRYWLPIFVLATGIGGYGIATLRNRLHGWLMHIFPALIILLLTLFSFHLVFFTKNNGLIAVSNRLVEYDAIRTDALHYIPQNAVVIVDRGDKIFFPARRVMYPLRDEGTLATLGTLSLRAPLFYYGITMTDTDFMEQNKKLELHGLRLDPVKTYTDSMLYRVENF